ncbi:hypothetical protein N311_00473, partial [Apaloderma vittatum]
TATIVTAVQGIESEVKEVVTEGNVVGQDTILLEQSFENREQKEDGLQLQESAESIQGQTGVEESILQECSERNEIHSARKQSTEGCENVDVMQEESQWQAYEEAVLEDREEISEVQRTVEESLSQDREFHSIKAVTPKGEPFAKQEHSEKEKLPVTDLTVEETREECLPAGQIAV